jgi:hypothetical protein
MMWVTQREERRGYEMREDERQGEEIGVPEEWKAMDVTLVVRFITDLMGVGALPCAPLWVWDWSRRKEIWDIRCDLREREQEEVYE